MAMDATSGRWQPDVTVATVVAREGRLLLVEEVIDGRHVINQPAGHLEPGESLLEAAVRETLEETGWTVQPTHFIGSYLWKANDGRSFLRFAFAAEALHHDSQRSLDTGIVRAFTAVLGLCRGGCVFFRISCFNCRFEIQFGKGFHYLSIFPCLFKRKPCHFAQ